MPWLMVPLLGVPQLMTLAMEDALADSALVGDALAFSRDSLADTAYVEPHPGLQCPQLGCSLSALPLVCPRWAPNNLFLSQKAMLHPPAAVG